MEKQKLPDGNQLTNLQSYEAATGTIDYGLTNDFMFHVLLQKNETALRGLCSAILHLPPDELKSATIINPISLNDNIESKVFVLDVHLLLNDNTFLNLEMQVVNYRNWPERALSYLCRSFDHLMSGEDYIKVKPAIHVGILDFDLFPDVPEFYAHNLLMNVKNHKIFTTKFQLNVLCLTQIDRATEEDRLWYIDQWAKLFKATTWEELKMIAKKDAALQSAGETLFTMNADYMIREKARAREDYERNERTHARLEAMLRTELAAQQQALAEKDEALVAQQQALAEKDEALAEKEKEIESLRRKLEQFKK